MYEDDVNAVVGGSCVVVGMSNVSLERAVTLMNKDNETSEIHAFTISEDADSVRRE